ncbi:MAG: FUSC family protein [Lachnospiraceae bacterium]|nr:FUSC family protein [Lachnospiraceae bacterium]
MKEKQGKGLLKGLFVDFIVFIVCICFIQIFKRAFGEANSIVGVAVLTGCFVFLKEDLGMKKKETCISFLMLFLILSFAPKLSLVNPYLGALINLVAIFAVLILSTYEYHKGNHMAFVLGYIFCQGNDVAGKDYILRIAGLLTGAALLSFVYMVSHKKEDTGIGFEKLLKGISLDNERTRWQFKLATGLTIIMFLGQVFNVPRAMWMSLTVLSLVRADEEEARRRRGKRVLGAFAGSLLFVIIIGVLVPKEYHQIVVLACGYMSIVLKEYLPKTICNAFAASVSAMVLFSVKQTAILRVFTNLAGVIFILFYIPLFDFILKKFKQMETVDFKSTVEE